MKILLTGATGFIGEALLPALDEGGHESTVLTRQSLPDTASRRHIASFDEIATDSRFDAVINLAGESMAGARWSAAYKQVLLDSRLHTTEALVQLLRRLSIKPDVMLSASAIGYYGHHGDEVLAEDGAVRQQGFSQALCQRWEQAAREVEELGIRLCLLRLGVVLDAGGGAMQELRRSFDLGIASWLGHGKQWLSWVHRRDVVRAIRFLLDEDYLVGPFNVTAPEAVTSRQFCQAMKRHKRTLLTVPVPAPVMRLLVGEMAEELLLNGQRVAPSGLLGAGFEFEYERLDDALQVIL